MGIKEYINESSMCLKPIVTHHSVCMVSVATGDPNNNNASYAFCAPSLNVRLILSFRVAKIFHSLLCHRVLTGY